MKSPFKSKTLWVNFIGAVVSFFPSVSKVLSPDQVLLVMSLANVVLRLVTKDKIGLE